MADIGGVPMIVQVWRRAVDAGIGPVVATTTRRGGAVELAGGEAVMTRNDHLNGTARIHEAVGAIRSGAEIVVNLQGDLPTIEAATVRAVLAPLAEPAVDIGTVCAEIVREEEKSDPNVVKLVGSPANLAEEDAGILRALTSRGAGRRGGRGRSTTTSASTPIGAPRLTATSPWRRPRWSSGSGWNSSARWRTACGSTRPL